MKKKFLALLLTLAICVTFMPTVFFQSAQEAYADTTLYNPTGSRTVVYHPGFHGTFNQDYHDDWDDYYKDVSYQQLYDGSLKAVINDTGYMINYYSYHLTHAEKQLDSDSGSTYDYYGNQYFLAKNLNATTSTTDPYLDVDEGFTFKGWYAYDNTAHKWYQYDFADHRTKADDIDLYAFYEWTNGTSFNVTYNLGEHGTFTNNELSEFTTFQQGTMAYEAVLSNDNPTCVPEIDTEGCYLKGVKQEAATLDIKVSAEDGYEFAGWYTDPDLKEEHKMDFGHNYVNGIRDITLYAKWKYVGHHFKVTYDLGNYGTFKIANTAETEYKLSQGNTMASIDVESNDETFITELKTDEETGTTPFIVPKTGSSYAFKGWYLDEDCTKKANFSHDYVGTTEDLTLYAKWVKANTLKVVYHAGDHAAFYGYKLSENTDDYQLDWTSDGDGSSEVTATYKSEENLSVYVEKIQAKSYRETLILNDIAMYPKSKEYTFAGWYTDETYTTKFNFAEKYSTAQNVYAKWVKHELSDDHEWELITGGAYDSKSLIEILLGNTFDEESSFEGLVKGLSFNLDGEGTAEKALDAITNTNINNSKEAWDSFELPGYYNVFGVKCSDRDCEARQIITLETPDKNYDGKKYDELTIDRGNKSYNDEFDDYEIFYVDMEKMFKQADALVDYNKYAVASGIMGGDTDEMFDETIDMAFDCLVKSISTKAPTKAGRYLALIAPGNLLQRLTRGFGYMDVAEVYAASTFKINPTEFNHEWNMVGFSGLQGSKISEVLGDWANKFLLNLHIKLKKSSKLTEGEAFYRDYNATMYILNNAYEWANTGNTTYGITTSLEDYQNQLPYTYEDSSTVTSFKDKRSEVLTDMIREVCSGDATGDAQSFAQQILDLAKSIYMTYDGVDLSYTIALYKGLIATQTDINGIITAELSAFDAIDEELYTERFDSDDDDDDDDPTSIDVPPVMIVDIIREVVNDISSLTAEFDVNDLEDTVTYDEWETFADKFNNHFNKIVATCNEPGCYQTKYLIMNTPDSQYNGYGNPVTFDTSNWISDEANCNVYYLNVSEVVKAFIQMTQDIVGTLNETEIETLIEGLADGTFLSAFDLTGLSKQPILDLMNARSTKVPTQPGKYIAFAIPKTMDGSSIEVGQLIIDAIAKVAQYKHVEDYSDYEVAKNLEKDIKAAFTWSVSMFTIRPETYSRVYSAQDNVISVKGLKESELVNPATLTLYAPDMDYTGNYYDKAYVEYNQKWQNDTVLTTNAQNLHITYYECINGDEQNLNKVSSVKKVGHYCAVVAIDPKTGEQPTSGVDIFGENANSVVVAKAYFDVNAASESVIGGGGSEGEGNNTFNTPLLAKGYSKTSKSNKITWNKITGATKYKVYYGRKGTAGYSHVKSTTGTSFTHKNLKKGKIYKYSVRAYNSKGVLIKTSKVAYVIANKKSSKYANTYSVTRTASNYGPFEVGTNYSLKSKVKVANYSAKKTVIALRYLCDNTKVATIDYTSGMLTTKAPGTAHVYIVAANGKYVKVTVTVK